MPLAACSRRTRPHHRRPRRRPAPTTAAAPPPPPIPARSTSANIESIDAFYLRTAGDPQLSPDGTRVAVHRPVRRPHRRRPTRGSGSRTWPRTARSRGAAARDRKAARRAGRPTASASRSQGATGDGKSGIVIANADATRRGAAGRRDGHEPSAAAASANASRGRPTERRSRSSPRRPGPSRRWRPTRSSSRATGIVRRPAMAAASTTTGGCTSSSPMSRRKQVRAADRGHQLRALDRLVAGRQAARCSSRTTSRIPTSSSTTTSSPSTSPRRR